MLLAKDAGMNISNLKLDMESRLGRFAEQRMVIKILGAVCDGLLKTIILSDCFIAAIFPVKSI